ncbi:MAG: SpoIVB peptidase [Clostridia bacterium]|nr:SpoIVB peptidase [Clostridia bacterium]
MKNKFLKLLPALSSLALVACSALLPSVHSEAAETHVAESEASVTAAAEETRVSSRLWELLFGTGEGSESTSGEAADTPRLIPGGTVFGAKIKTRHLTVTEDESALGILAGDEIIRIDGKEISGTADVKKILSEHTGGTLEVVLLRKNEEIVRKITPEACDGGYKLGLSLRDGAAGIGTVTFIDPATHAFGGLGHGICDPASGAVVEMKSGEVTGVILGGVKRGEAGKPGELRGILTDKCAGELVSNTSAGVFGNLNETPDASLAIPVAKSSEVHTGEAKIISTVKSGLTREYRIEISEITKSTDGTKCFKIKVTDPVLIALSGGIVRGMSGSPIIQDGKLVGAVTHVMISNPTEGYGIFIENMLNASNARNELPKAA